MVSEDIWRDYVAFLRDHVPAAHANLAPGATNAAIARLEEKLGITLPESLKAVWRLNDGQRKTMLADSNVTATPCVPTLSFLSVDCVADVWQMWADLRKSEGEKGLEKLDAGASSLVDGVVKPLYTSPKWIPIWADPGRADYIGLDFDPGEAGRVGQVINFGRDEEQHWQCADDFDDLLQFLIEEVRSGRWEADVVPLEDGKELPWFGDADKSLFNNLHRRWKSRYQPAPRG